jgi:hypothetical protein
MGAKYAEVSDPVESEKKKTVKSFCLPNASSRGLPKTISEYILKPR